MPSASHAAGPTDIIGREAFIAHLWHILEERSLILSAERRFGKTYVIQKMEAEPPTDVLTFYQDMSDVHTAAAFTEKVCANAKDRLNWPRKIAREAVEAASRLKGAKANVKIPSIDPNLHMPEASLDLPTLAALPWQVKLTAAIMEIVTGYAGRVVFFWDEMPWMIGHIQKTEGAETALELLELLRVLRQNPVLRTKLRMVYTGSIGFHHVLVGSQAAPQVNDLKPMTVLPLEDNHAQEYVRHRLAREGVAVAEEGTVREIAEAVGGVPFYLQNLTQSLSAPGHPIQAGDADRFLTKMLKQSPEDWQLPHYDQRIDLYYSEAQRPIARALLDILAVTEEVADFATLRNLLNAKHRVKNEETVRHVLDLLRQDHYLWPDPYRFQLPLIRRFWRARRGL